jgi:CheY-like chemotaxis protein
MATILMVKDDAAFADAAAGCLRAYGHRVVVAGGGRIALAAAVGQGPDLVLLDLGRPEITGAEVCRAFQTEPEVADIPILVVTAGTDREALDEVRDLGVTDIMIKGHFALDELAAAVARFVPAGQR